MKERLFIVLSLVLIVGALVGLNAASYAPVEREPDNEARPNRSTYNAGASGTRAFYDFLRETNRPVARWQEKTSKLLDAGGANPKTFVIIGEPPRDFEKQEINDLLKWTAQGNKLVIISRDPKKELLPASGNWQPEIVKTSLEISADSSNVNEMTKDVTAARAVQPSVLTANVDSVLPSKFASSVNFKSLAEARADDANKDDAAQNDKSNFENYDYEAPEEYAMFAPVAHVSAAQNRTILADYNYGAGRIIVLTDPYIVSNGGIESVDNLRLATNIVTSGNGLIAFDEFHQGYGASGNSFLNFFAGTPLPAIALQIALLVALAVYTRGRRFARALPAPNPDRRSKLEYVQAMAELQRRTKAYDLALENIYGRVRRELARFAGVDGATESTILAARVAERSRLKKDDLIQLFKDCEDVIHGERTNDKIALSLAARLREIERELGFSRRTARL